jgi:leucine dehydrogenase
MPNSNSNDSIFSQLEAYGHKKVVFCSDPDTGLKAIIAIHDTTLGPALGGTRMWAYKSEADALHDVLRLSKSMTYKSAIAGLNLGGGKAVIIGDSRKDKTEALLRKLLQLKTWAPTRGIWNTSGWKPSMLPACPKLLGGAAIRLR